jgi:hypothetical protein
MTGFFTSSSLAVAAAAYNIGQSACPRLIRVGRGAITSYLSRITTTLPASPSIVTVCPLRMRRVATPVPMTPGMPYSRATMKLWLSGTTCRPRRCQSGRRAGLRRPRVRRSSWPACLSCASAAAPWQAQRGSQKRRDDVTGTRPQHERDNHLLNLPSPSLPTPRLYRLPARFAHASRVQLPHPPPPTAPARPPPWPTPRASTAVLPSRSSSV